MIEYIGIDIGGTNIRIGAIDEEENIIFQYIEPTFKEVVTIEELYIKIKKLIKKVPDYQQAKGIGIGAPGSVDPEIGQIITSKNLTILNNFPLVQKLSKDFNKPIFLENDARVATFAEAIKGKGKDKNIICYITISTGLGGGVLKSKDKFLVDVIKEFELKAHPLAKNTIIDTTFFEEPGIIGAALLAKSKITNNKE